MVWGMGKRGGVSSYSPKHTQPIPVGAATFQFSPLCDILLNRLRVPSCKQHVNEAAPSPQFFSGVSQHTYAFSMRSRILYHRDLQPHPVSTVPFHDVPIPA